MRGIVDHVKVSEKGKDVLTRVKKRTGMEQWNDLCRVALWKSLSEPTVPRLSTDSLDVAIDMEWKTFGGNYQEIIAAAVVIKALEDGIDATDKSLLGDYFRAHLERGIAGLNSIRSLADLCAIAQGVSTTQKS